MFLSCRGGVTVIGRSPNSKRSRKSAVDAEECPCSAPEEVTEDRIVSGIIRGFSEGEESWVFFKLVKVI